jgi:hypothetical protein
MRTFLGGVTFHLVEINPIQTPQLQVTECQRCAVQSELSQAEVGGPCSNPWVWLTTIIRAILQPEP